MPVKIFNITAGSPCSKKRIIPGDLLISVNGHEVNDVLDYSFFTGERRLTLIFKREKKFFVIKIEKGEKEDLGLEFESYLMDRQRTCQNNCVFCFIDQLPKGLRDSLYFKDDDSRMSFLFGNYITLTNLTEQEVQRIIDMRISPVNVSVHTTNPELRVKMMKNKNAGRVLNYIERFAMAGIKVNTQLVVCPGMNDGKELERSLKDLGALFPGVQSIAVVPVGLTCHRKGLAPIEAFTAEAAKRVINIIDDFNSHFLWYNKEIIAFPADEFFLKAHLPMPGEEYYGDYPQLENGVGMWALLKSEFENAVDNFDFSKLGGMKRSISMATGKAAHELISGFVQKLKNKVPGLEIMLHVIENKTFGEYITVAGLLTGKDIAGQLQSESLGQELLIPAAALRHEGDMFLDNMTLSELEKILNVKITPIENSGSELLEAMLSKSAMKGTV